MLMLASTRAFRQLTAAVYIWLKLHQLRVHKRRSDARRLHAIWKAWVEGRANNQSETL